MSLLKQELGHGRVIRAPATQIVMNAHKQIESTRWTRKHQVRNLSQQFERKLAGTAPFDPDAGSLTWRPSPS